jgi:CRISPR-associated protein (TIGR03986 family)
LDPQGRPVIPGSSLRGAIRTLFEILTFSKIQPVTNEKPFYRSLSRDRLGLAYRSRMSRLSSATQLPRAGFIGKNSDGTYMIKETCSVLRVAHDSISKLFPSFSYGHNASYTPQPPLQHSSIWVKGDAAGRDAAAVKISAAPGLEEAMLVLTGWAPSRLIPGTGKKAEKSKEFAFLKSIKQPPIQIPAFAWERFHDQDQITQYQERAFPPREHLPGGHLREGDPVFFVCNSMGELDFFGRAQMFRLPYDKSPYDLLPSEHKESNNDTYDLAEVAFGFVPQHPSDRRKPIRSRIEFEDAVAPEIVRTLDAMAPKVLSSPKVSCYQHYLTQDGGRDERELTTYLNGDTTAIRGHKLYWHRWNGIGSVKAGNQDEVLLDPGTQYTTIRPIPTNTVFRGRIHFHNLLDFELGALWAALALPEEHAHKIGMGKSLGLGSIRIEPTIFILDARTRYCSWQQSGFHKCDKPRKIYQSAFEDHVSAHVKDSQEPLWKNGAGLTSVYRLHILHEMLKWRDVPSFFGDTETLPLRSQSGGRDFSRLRSEGWILPTPLAVTSPQYAEPLWPDSERPSPAPALTDIGHASRGVELRPKSTPNRSQDTPIASRVTLKGNQVRGSEKDARKLDICTALEEKSKKGGWVFGIDRMPGTKGRLNPKSGFKLPDDLKPGMKLEMFVARNADGSYTLSLP